MSDTQTAELDLGPLPVLIGYALRRAQMAVFQDFHETFKETGIRTAQFSVMHVLHGNPGVRQSQVSQALGIQRANFVPLFDELERKGLAERRAVAGDRRAKGLFLTEQGSALMERLAAMQAGHERRLVARLGGAGAKHTLIGLLHRLADPGFDHA